MTLLGEMRRWAVDTSIADAGLNEQQQQELNKTLELLAGKDSAPPKPLLKLRHSKPLREEAITLDKVEAAETESSVPEAVTTDTKEREEEEENTIVDSEAAMNVSLKIPDADQPPVSEGSIKIEDATGEEESKPLEGNVDNVLIDTG